MLSEPSYAIYWHPDVVHYNMEGIIFYSTGWLKTVCVLTALFWSVSFSLPAFLLSHWR